MKTLLLTLLIALVLCSGETNTKPALLSFQPSPSYSALATKAGVKGTVTLQILVGAAGGRPAKVEVIRRLGWGLDEKAIEAVSQWKFRAAEVKGKPVEAPATVECQFGGPSVGDLNFGAMTFDLPKGCRVPVLLKFVAPDFIQGSRATSEAGEVSFSINAQGRVENLHVEQSSSPAMQTAVLDAMRQWLFRDAEHSGKRISTRGHVEFGSVNR